MNSCADDLLICTGTVRNLQSKTARQPQKNKRVQEEMECLPFSGIRAVMEKANKMQQAGEKIIHLEIGRPDFDTPEKIKKAANESLAAGHVFYTSNYGIPKLREAIAKWENENHGTDYEASEVLVTVGVLVYQKKKGSNQVTE